jgi:DNA-binding PadR family transcriptional regulator
MDIGNTRPRRKSYRRFEDMDGTTGVKTKEERAPGFIPGLALALQGATPAERARLNELIAQGELFQFHPEDLALFLHLTGAIEDDEGRRYANLDELKEATRRPGGEDLPGIMAGLSALERHGLIYVSWSPAGPREKYPFRIKLRYLVRGLEEVLDSLNDAFSVATIEDLKHLGLLFHDHPRLYQEVKKLGILLHLIASGTGTFTVQEIIEAFGLDRREGKAPIVNALDYLNKEKLVGVQWTGEDACTIDVDRLRGLFNITEGGRS